MRNAVMFWQRINDARRRWANHCCVWAIIAFCTFTAGQLFAVPISGTVSFIGNATLNNPLGNATGFAGFSGTTVLGGTETGAYSGIAGGTPVTFFSFTFNPLPPSSIELWTFTIGATTYSFDITSETTYIQNTSFLDIGGAGVAYITGYDPTPATWTITGGSASDPAININIGSSATVPDPASYWPVMLLALVAVFGAFLTARNKSNSDLTASQLSAWAGGRKSN